MKQSNDDWEGEKKKNLQNRESCPSLLVSQFSHFYGGSSPMVPLKSLSSLFKSYLDSQVGVCLSLWISGFFSDFNIYYISLSFSLLDTMYLALPQMVSETKQAEFELLCTIPDRLWKLRQFHTKDSIVL